MSSDRPTLQKIHSFLRACQASRAKLRIRVVRSIIADFGVRLTRRQAQRVCAHYGAIVAKCWATF